MPSSWQYPYYPPQQVQALVKVTGLDGAKAYQMPPNSAVPLFDANDDVFYVKTTDGAGFPTVRAFRFEPIDLTPQQQVGDYVTKDEFKSFVAEIKEALNAKQPVPRAE